MSTRNDDRNYVYLPTFLRGILVVSSIIVILLGLLVAYSIATGEPSNRALHDNQAEIIDNLEFIVCLLVAGDNSPSTIAKCQTDTGKPLPLLGGLASAERTTGKYFGGPGAIYRATE